MNTNGLNVAVQQCYGTIRKTMVQYIDEACPAGIQNEKRRRWNQQKRQNSSFSCVLKLAVRF